MQANNSYPSFPLPFHLNKVQYLTHRQILAFCYLLFSFTDIITTYFGIVNFGLQERITWTQWIINQWGWNGVIIRDTLTSILVLLIFRYMPNRVFSISKYSAWLILVVYILFTTFNNLYLIMTVN
jgi:hypothetical protein